MGLLYLVTAAVVAAIQPHSAVHEVSHRIHAHEALLY